MSSISFPESFPSVEEMLNVLKKTIERSWKVDMDIEDIQLWLSNFRGQVFNKVDEQRLALWLLCNFTYYNEDEVNHMCKTAFKNLLHRLMLDNTLSSEDEAEECIRKTAFTSIGRASESGGFILYHFRQESHLDLDRFIFPTNILETESDNIVCVDDVMMSGGTAERFFHQNKTALEKKKIYYISLITTEEAISKLESLGITVIYCAKLDNRNRVFSDESLAFYKYPEIKACAKEFAKGYGHEIEPQKPLGYNNGEYCFGLFYNVPNNSLPIFWSDKNGWKPIVVRKEKYQNAKQAKRKYNFFI